jgi:hypothetical protein
MSAFDDGLWNRLVDEHAADRVGLGPVPDRGRRRPLLVGASGLAALSLAGALAAVLTLTGGAGNAFAGWTSQPTTPTTTQLAAARAYCDTNIPTPGLPLKLIDTRGPFTFLVYSNGSWNNFCTIGPSFRNASGWSTSPPLKVSPGRLFLWAEHTTTDSGQPYGFLIARAGDGVTAAVLTLASDTQVTATVQNGWVVAWWPGSRQVTRAQLTTPSGTQTQTFPQKPCGLHNCHGGPHGGAPGGGPGGG